MYCTKCGNELPQNSPVCPHCHAETEFAPKTVEETHKFALLWEIFGFFLPLIGGICYLVWNKTRPARAHSCAVGAMFGGLFFGFLAAILFLVFAIFFVICAGMSMWH